MMPQDSTGHLAREQSVIITLSILWPTEQGLLVSSCVSCTGAGLREALSAEPQYSPAHSRAPGRIPSGFPGIFPPDCSSSRPTRVSALATSLPASVSFLQFLPWEQTQSHLPQMT